MRLFLTWLAPMFLLVLWSAWREGFVVLPRDRPAVMSGGYGNTLSGPRGGIILGTPEEEAAMRAAIERWSTRPLPSA